MARFSRLEMKFLLGIGSALALRQFGLIMVMPFMAIYGKELLYSTPGLIGLSLGVFGLSQAIFQIPFGNASDRLGRKPVILVGFLIFISGLILAYFAKNIYVFILARTLQGSGAIMAAAYAWVGDVIPSAQRNRGMSIISMLVGMSATMAFIGGPILYRWFDVPELFLICAILALAAWFFILFFIDSDVKGAGKLGTKAKTGRQQLDGDVTGEDLKRDEGSQVRSKDKADYWAILRDGNMMKIFFAGFMINYLLVSEFFIAPQLLEDTLGVSRLWMVFAPATLLGILAMRVGARYADQGYMVPVGVLAFASVALGGLLYFNGSVLMIGLGLTLFMVGYMSLVTLIPATVTKMSAKSYRGRVTGVFNTIQFVGSFLGGSLTGLVWGYDPTYAVILLVVVALTGALLIGRAKIVA